MKTKHRHQKKLKTKIENKKKVKKKAGQHGTITVTQVYDPPDFVAGSNYESSDSSVQSDVHVPLSFSNVQYRTYTVTGDSKGLQKLNTYAGATLLDKVISARDDLVPNGLSHWSMSTTLVSATLSNDYLGDGNGHIGMVYIYHTHATQNFPWRFV